MATPLRLLLVEDSANDAELLLQELEASGFEVTVEREHLGARQFHVLADDGLEPLERERHAVRSGTQIGNDVAAVRISDR